MSLPIFITPDRNHAMMQTRWAELLNPALATVDVLNTINKLSSKTSGLATTNSAVFITITNPATLDPMQVKITTKGKPVELSFLSDGRNQGDASIGASTAVSTSTNGEFQIIRTNADNNAPPGPPIVVCNYSLLCVAPGAAAGGFVQIPSSAIRMVDDKVGAGIWLYTAQYRVAGGTTPAVFCTNTILNAREG